MLLNWPRYVIIIISPSVLCPSRSWTTEKRKAKVFRANSSAVRWTSWPSCGNAFKGRVMGKATEKALSRHRTKMRAWGQEGWKIPTAAQGTRATTQARVNAAGLDAALAATQTTMATRTRVVREWQKLDDRCSTRVNNEPTCFPPSSVVILRFGYRLSTQHRIHYFTTSSDLDFRCFSAQKNNISENIMRDERAEIIKTSAIVVRAQKVLRIYKDDALRMTSTYLVKSTKTSSCGQVTEVSIQHRCYIVIEYLFSQRCP